MNNGIKITTLLSVLGASTLMAQEGDFRSPLSIQRGYMHWMLQPIEETFWFDSTARCNRPDWMLHYNSRSQEDIDNSDENCNQLYFEKWAAGYTRSAGDAFYNPNCKNKDTSRTASLGTVFFGQESFTGMQAFANSLLTTQQLALNNPLLGAAVISPAAEYREKGVYWGGRVEYRWGNENKWHVGGRLNLPFKVIEVDAEAGSEEGLEDLFSVHIINSTVGTTLTTGQLDLAIRFDFLRALNLAENMPLLAVVGSGATQNFNIGEAAITGLSAEGTPSSVPAMYEVRASNIQELITLSAAKANSKSFRRQASEVSGALAASGLGGADGTVFYMQTGTQYQATGNLLTNSAALSTLFLVPRAEDANVNTLSTETENGVSRILSAVQLADLGDRLASDFFVDQGIDLFGTSRVLGVGDMDGEVYVGYGDRSLMWLEKGDCCNWYVDGILGIKFPTGTKSKEDNALDVYRLETGNNRHWELNFGIEGGVQPCNWFALNMGYRFNHAFKRSQFLPATFTGATVKNLGPAVKGDVSWNYNSLYIDFNFFHPCNKELGFVVGYELFAKQKDHLSYCGTTAVDFLGVTQTLDASVATMHTKAMLHKIRGELFHRWNFFELFAGGYQAVGGRDAMKESEGHIGFVVYF